MSSHVSVLDSRILAVLTEQHFQMLPDWIRNGSVRLSLSQFEPDGFIIRRHSVGDGGKGCRFTRCAPAHGVDRWSAALHRTAADSWETGSHSICAIICHDDHVVIRAERMRQIFARRTAGTSPARTDTSQPTPTLTDFREAVRIVNLFAASDKSVTIEVRDGALRAIMEL